MLQNIWQSIVQFVTTWSQNSVVAAIIGPLIGSLLTLSIVFFGRIVDFIISMSKWLGAIISKRDKDYAFEKAYLTWIINQHRYLGLLPARVVAARWGEEGRNVDLEKVYISLHVSAQGGDKNSETSTSASSSWRKQPWLYAMSKNALWFYTFFILLMFLSIPIMFIISFRYSYIIGLAITISLVLLYILLFFIRRRLLRGEETYQLGDLALAIDTHKQLVIRGDP